jgi:hypothetical protein
MLVGDHHAEEIRMKMRREQIDLVLVDGLFIHLPQSAAIPAPLAGDPSASVIVGIELPSGEATRAVRVELTVAAIDAEGKTRAQLRFTTNFAASVAGRRVGPTPVRASTSHPGATRYGSRQSGRTRRKAACSPS